MTTDNGHAMLDPLQHSDEQQQSSPLISDILVFKAVSDQMKTNLPASSPLAHYCNPHDLLVDSEKRSEGVAIDVSSPPETPSTTNPTKYSEKKGSKDVPKQGYVMTVKKKIVKTEEELELEREKRLNLEEQSRSQSRQKKILVRRKTLPQIKAKDPSEANILNEIKNNNTLCTLKTIQHEKEDNLPLSLLSFKPGPKFDPDSDKIVSRSVLGNPERFLRLETSTESPLPKVAQLPSEECSQGEKDRISEPVRPPTIVHNPNFANFPKEKVDVKQKKALSSFQTMEKEWRLVQGRIASRLGKDPSELVMNQELSFRQRREQLDVLDKAQGRRNLEVGLFDEMVPMGNQMSGLYSVKRKNATMDIEKIGVPLSFRKGLGPHSQPPATTSNPTSLKTTKYYKSSTKDLRDFIDDDDVFEPDFDYLEVIGTKMNIVFEGDGYIPLPSAQEIETEELEDEEDVDVEEEEMKPNANHEMENASLMAPRFELDKNRLFFENLVGQLSRRHIVVRNTGTTVIYFLWKRRDIGPDETNKESSPVVPEGCSGECSLPGCERFFFSDIEGTILPGDCHKFTFVFQSSSHGMFHERWEFTTTPNPESKCFVDLKGMALVEDEYEGARNNVEIYLAHKQIEHIISNLIETAIISPALLLCDRPTTPPPQPSPRDFFIKHNLHHNLFYTPQRLVQFEGLAREIIAVLLDEHKDEIEKEESYSESIPPTTLSTTEEGGKDSEESLDQPSEETTTPGEDTSTSLPPSSSSSAKRSPLRQNKHQHHDNNLLSSSRHVDPPKSSYESESEKVTPDFDLVSTSIPPSTSVPLDFSRSLTWNYSLEQLFQMLALVSNPSTHSDLVTRLNRLIAIASSPVYPDNAVLSDVVRSFLLDLVSNIPDLACKCKVTVGLTPDHGQDRLRYPSLSPQTSQVPSRTLDQYLRKIAPPPEPSELSDQAELSKPEEKKRRRRRGNNPSLAELNEKKEKTESNGQPYATVNEYELNLPITLSDARDEHSTSSLLPSHTPSQGQKMTNTTQLPPDSSATKKKDETRQTSTRRRRTNKRKEELDEQAAAAELLDQKEAEELKRKVNDYKLLFTKEIYTTVDRMILTLTTFAFQSLTLERHIIAQLPLAEFPETRPGNSDCINDELPTIDIPDDGEKKKKESIGRERKNVRNRSGRKKKNQKR